MNKILQGDAFEILKTLTEESVDCIITSPPYFGLRDYGVKGQVGLEEIPQDFIDSMVLIFRAARRVLKKNGTLWLNIGDSYSSFRDSKSTPDNLRGDSAGTKVPVSNNRNPRNLRRAGLKHKDLIGIPWMLAFALRADGWYLRSDIIWHKPNPMPESVKDRPTKSHEYVFLLTKSETYFYDTDAIREPHIWADDKRNDGKRHTYADTAKHNQKDARLQRTKTDNVSFHPAGKNKRTVWNVPTKPFRGAHFATFPEALIRPMILAGSPRGGGYPRPFLWGRDHRSSGQKAGPRLCRYRTQRGVYKNCTRPHRQNAGSPFLI